MPVNSVSVEGGQLASIVDGLTIPGIDWRVWEAVARGMGSLKEVLREWTIDDLEDCIYFLSLRDEIDQLRQSESTP